MDPIILIIFGFVYLGMILGEIPGLALDRTGMALLGAIALVATEKVTPEAAWKAVDVPTIALLFGLMVVSAQFRMSGFYTAVTRRLAKAQVSPEVLLALLIGMAGVLSALLVNDIVCLAMAPLLVEGCTRRKLDPVPFLLGLACAANIGSAATLIGNPQNMLIGQALGLSFARYLVQAAVPALAGMAVVWLIIKMQARGRWTRELPPAEVRATAYNRWQTSKGVGVLAVLMGGFLFAHWPREALALAAAGLLLTSRRMASREMLGEVDWHLLVLFISLFVVHHGLADSGWLERMMQGVRTAGIRLENPGWLFGMTVGLSNLVSNVPAVMLLLPAAKSQGALAGPILALASTLAGNLFIVGSIANIIVVEQAAQYGVKIGWKEHAKVGVPVTLATLAISAAWLWVIA